MKIEEKNPKQLLSHLGPRKNIKYNHCLDYFILHGNWKTILRKLYILYIKFKNFKNLILCDTIIKPTIIYYYLINNFI